MIQGRGHIGPGSSASGSSTAADIDYSDGANWKKDQSGEWVKKSIDEVNAKRNHDGAWGEGSWGGTWGGSGWNGWNGDV
jgi:hypothetical protein